MSRAADQPATRRVAVVVDRDFPGLEDPQARRIAEEAHGSHVLIIAPAQPVPGERWIIDLDARREQARRRLRSWVGALATHARALEAEVGDESARLAIADAEGFRPHVVVTSERAVPPGARPQHPLVSGLSAAAAAQPASAAR